MLAGNGKAGGDGKTFDDEKALLRMPSRSSLNFAINDSTSALPCAGEQTSGTAVAVLFMDCGSLYCVKLELGDDGTGVDESMSIGGLDDAREEEQEE